MKEHRQDKIGKTKEFWVFYEKMGNVGDFVTSSGRPFHVRAAAATLNILLPTVDSLNDGTTQ